MYETERLIQELNKYKIAISNLVVNQLVFPESNCRKCMARYKMQKKYLDQIAELYDDMHITLMELQDEEVRGREKLTRYGELLMVQKEAPKI
jgi:arsenite-transporting ATPase